jgi:adenosylcobinamide-phosphate synthase
METTALVTLIAALLLDGFVGEYPTALHPVVWIGKSVSFLLRLAPQNGWWPPLLFGLLLALGLPAACFLASQFVLYLGTHLPWGEIVLGTFLLKASFALRELGVAAKRVRSRVAAGDIAGARAALRSLCSRDPEQLESEALLAATVQSLAENASDSFVAPLCYFLLFGVPGAVAYRAINTLDAMIGYRGPFEALGKAAARLDDAVNFVPARLTAALLLLAGCLTGRPIASAWRVFRRDRVRTPSPNGGRPMAMMAGLLGVRLEKKGVYSLGDASRPVTPETVQSAWPLVILASGLMVALCVLAILICHLPLMWS